MGYDHSPLLHQHQLNYKGKGLPAATGFSPLCCTYIKSQQTVTIPPLYHGMMVHYYLMATTTIFEYLLLYSNHQLSALLLQDKFLFCFQLEIQAPCGIRCLPLTKQPQKYFQLQFKNIKPESRWSTLLKYVLFKMNSRATPQSAFACLQGTVMTDFIVVTLQPSSPQHC